MANELLDFEEGEDGLGQVDHVARGLDVVARDFGSGGGVHGAGGPEHGEDDKRETDGGRRILVHITDDRV